MERWRRPAAVDVGYPPDGGAHAAVVVGDDVRFATLVEEATVQLDRVEEYEPGLLYRRELPAITAVLTTIAPVDLLVVDGYVDLDPDGRHGLGAHAHAAFGIPVVGVAKTAFRAATHAVPVRRGGASRPLFVTAAGLAVQDAAALVAAMDGRFRLPDALRRVDALAQRKPG